MVKIPVRKKKCESGQAVVLVLTAMTVFLLAAGGLAIDGAHLYAHRQLAQAAADAAAQAGIESIFYATNTAGAHAFTATSGSNFTCTASDAKTPCYFAQTLNGFNQASDTVKVAFVTPATAGVSASGTTTIEDPVIQVTVQRNVPATLMKFLGWNTIPVQARGTAGIEDVLAAIPIIVTHPSNAGSLNFNGNPSIHILGGPRRSIQVNSTNANAIDTTACSNATVDLHLAGPNGDGADFGNSAESNPNFLTPCFTFVPGVGKYFDPTHWIVDPLASVPAPAVPTTPRTGPIHVSAGLSATVGSYTSTGQAACPSTKTPGGCDFFLPGDYATGISASGPNNYIAYFFPGIYYIHANGFQDGSNADMEMYPGANADTSAHGTGSGMLVYNTGTGTFQVGSNGAANLVGSDSTSDYKGILLFEDRNAPANTGTGSHKLGGGGNMTLVGTVYINNPLSVVTGTHYQNVKLQGNPGSSTNIQGEIIVNELQLGGNAGITMTLSPLQQNIRQIALIQ